MVSGRNVIGQMRTRINVIASTQAIGWQPIAIHVKRMMWNKRGTSLQGEKTVERSVGIKASWFIVLLAEMPSGSVASQRCF
jgi:hypothetical protein